MGYFASADVAAIEQFWLVVTGVAVGAVLLPELTEDLWTIRPEQVRKTIPDQRILELQRSLIVASCGSGEWAELVWQRGLWPMLEAGSRPERIVWDSKYDITIHLAQEPGDKILSNRVETITRASRVLPQVNPRRYWVSVARTEEALQAEYRSPNCLARELVIMPLDDAVEWKDWVARSCHVRIAINGVSHDADLGRSDSLKDVVRWYFDVSDDQMVGRLVPFVLQFDFPTSRYDCQFLVLFKDYYSAGTTEISLRLNGADQETDLRCVAYTAHGAGEESGDIVKSVSKESQMIMFSTAGSSLLWPGSGLYFSW